MEPVAFHSVAFHSIKVKYLEHCWYSTITGQNTQPFSAWAWDSALDISHCHGLIHFHRPQEPGTSNLHFLYWNRLKWFENPNQLKTYTASEPWLRVPDITKPQHWSWLWLWHAMAHLMAVPELSSPTWNSPLGPPGDLEGVIRTISGQQLGPRHGAAQGLIDITELRITTI